MPFVRGTGGMLQHEDVSLPCKIHADQKKTKENLRTQ
jgi:hypothetical protein